MCVCIKLEVNIWKLEKCLLVTTYVKRMNITYLYRVDSDLINEFKYSKLNNSELL